MCDVWKANRELDELSARVLEKHRDSFDNLGVQNVILSGGEPLMHGNLWRVCRMFKELDVHITLESSGLLIADNATNIAKWIDTVIVPIEGPQSLHDRIRNSDGAFSRMKEGIELLREAEPEQEVIARTVVQKMNYPYLSEIISTATDLQLDGVEFVAIDMATPGFNHPNPATSGQALNESPASQRVTQELQLRSVDQLIFSTILNRIEVDFSDELEIGFIRGGKDSLRALASAFDRSLSTLSSHDVRCNAPWHSAVIEATGKVKPCPYQPAYGTIRKLDLKEILNSENALAFRRKLDPAMNSICAGCTAQQMFGSTEG
jgi:Fe-coproporphyrin III synthase